MKTWVAYFGLMAWMMFMSTIPVLAQTALTTSDYNVPYGIPQLDGTGSLTQNVKGAIDNATVGGVPLSYIIPELGPQNRSNLYVFRTMVNAKSGVAGLDANGDWAGVTVGDVGNATLNTGSITRTISSLANDTPSLGNTYSLSGSSTAADITAAINSLPDGSTVDLPVGSQLPAQYVFPDSTGLGRLIREERTGTLSNMQMGGDSNILEAYNNGTLAYYRSYANVADQVRPIMWLDYTNNMPVPSSGTTADHRVVNFHGTSLPGSAGNMVVNNTVTDSRGTAGYNGFDIGQYNWMNSYGTNWKWNEVLQQSRMAHTPITYDGTTSSEQDYVAEWDMSGSGMDATSSAYDPTAGWKTFLLLSSWIDSATPWVANHAYSVGDAVSQQVNGVWSIFKCTVAGTTGSSAPTWSLDYTKTFTDGSVTWQYTMPSQQEISKVIELSSHDTAMTHYGTFLSTDATFYNAVMDFSKANFTTDTHTVLRLPANAGLDLSGDATAAGQNVHWLGYLSANNGLNYLHNGSQVFAIYDDGSVTADGKLTVAGTLVTQSGIVITAMPVASIGSINSPPTGMTVYASDEGTTYTYNGSVWTHPTTSRVYANIPSAGGYTGESFYCTDCYSTEINPAGTPSAGIPVYWNGTAWRDAEGQPFGHGTPTAPSLPTTDPKVAGAPWINGGYLMISAGE